MASVKAERLRNLSCQIFHLSYCCKSKYVLNPTDMAKIAIKSEKLTPFGGIFSIMEQFDSMLSPIIDHQVALWGKGDGVPNQTIRAFQLS